MSAIEDLTKVIIEEIEAQSETDLYSQFRDSPDEVLVDGNMNVTALARRLRPLLEAAWEKGMTECKLLNAGIRPVIRNPYLEES